VSIGHRCKKSRAETFWETPQNFLEVRETFSETCETFSALYEKFSGTHKKFSEGCKKFPQTRETFSEKVFTTFYFPLTRRFAPPSPAGRGFLKFSFSLWEKVP